MINYSELLFGLSISANIAMLFIIIYMAIRFRYAKKGVGEK